jgi:hypothetical protein
MPQVYVAKPERVHAEVYDAATMPATLYPTAWPWVCNCSYNPLFADGRPHVHGRDGQQGVTATDLIVALVVNPNRYWVMTEAEFAEVYGPGGGGPEVET